MAATDTRLHMKEAIMSLNALPTQLHQSFFFSPQHKLTNAVFSARHIYPYDVCSLGRLTGMSQGCRLRHDPFRKPTLPLPLLLQLVPSLIGSFGSATYRNAIIQCMVNTEVHIHLTKLSI